LASTLEEIAHELRKINRFTESVPATAIEVDGAAVGAWKIGSDSGVSQT